MVVVELVGAQGAMIILDLTAIRNLKGRGSAREYVYHTLKYNILHLILKPGTKMSEQEISDKFRVSRTPVREVFVHLFQDGLVDIMPQRGTYVSLINLHHLEEGRFARELLEKAVIKNVAGQLSENDIFQLESNLAAQEITYRKKNYIQMHALDEMFHETIFRACGKERTWAMISKLNYDFFRVRVLRLSHDLHWDKILAQHHEIYQALRDGRKEVAEDIISNHLQMVIFEKDAIKAEYSEYFDE